MRIVGLVISVVGFLWGSALTGQTRPATEAGLDSPGVLRPGDLIRLRIWREQDLSGDFQVDEQGSVVLPKIGPMSIRGRSAAELKAMLVERYSTYLRDPAIDVTILHRVNVLGAVKNPGLYPVDPTMTVADVLALAGGAAPDGNPEKGSLIRGGERINVKLSQGTKVADTPIQSGDQLYVPQRSWISRNPGVVAGTLTAVAGIVVTLMVR
jgi:polysaccharide export outer membrane protein